MEFLQKIMDILYNHIHNPETLEKARLEKNAFTRKRKLPFYLCLIIGLSHFTGSLAYGLNDFFSSELNSPELITGSAYTHAREHFDFSPYKDGFELVRNATDDYYRRSGKLKTRFGLQILAVDGSLVALPDKKELLQEFGGTGRKARSATARMTLIYDALNDIIYESALDPIAVDERSQAIKLISNLSAYLDLSQTLLIFDRGYASDELIRFLDSLNVKYLMLIRRKFKRGLEFAPLGDSPVWVANSLKRIVKLKLDNGESEILLTNVHNIPAEAFKELYFLRWPVEIEIDTVKNKIEMPNFNAVLKNGIYQDFWISMLLANLVGIIALEADEIIQSRSGKRKKKHKYQSNISEVVNALHIDLGRILLASDKEERKQRLNHLLSYASQNEEPVCPNRSFPRDLVRKVRYHYNRKHH